MYVFLYSFFHIVSLYSVHHFCWPGITNHEEYSLIYELTDYEKERTLTLKKSFLRDQKKLDEMKKKYHTDDECKISTFI